MTREMDSPSPSRSRFRSPAQSPVDHQGHRCAVGGVAAVGVGAEVLQIDFPTVIIINYYCHCYISIYVAFGTIITPDLNLGCQVQWPKCY